MGWTTKIRNPFWKWRAGTVQLLLFPVEKFGHLQIKSLWKVLICNWLGDHFYQKNCKVVA